MSFSSANIDFEFPEASYGGGDPGPVIGRVRCTRRQIVDVVHTREMWNANGVHIGREYDVIDVAEWAFYTLGQNDKTKMYRLVVRNADGETGAWWLPAHCFEDVTPEEDAACPPSSDTVAPIAS